MDLRYPIWVNNHCSYPLHPTDGYLGPARLRTRHKLPPGTLLTILARWYDFAPGEWWWCTRCRRRDAARNALVQRMYSNAQQASDGYKKWHYTARQRQRILANFGPASQKLGGRFVTAQAQTRYAQRHAPEGLTWCPWGLHYRPAEDRAQAQRYRTANWCTACYGRYSKFQDFYRATQSLKQYGKRRQKAVAMQHEIGALTRELAGLRRLRVALLEEMAGLKRPDDTRPMSDPVSVVETTIGKPLSVPSWEETEARLPPPVRDLHAQRRKAYSV